MEAQEQIIEQNSCINGERQPTFWQRNAFRIGVGAFVVVTSFLYGISAGLEKKSSRATAAVSPLWAYSDAQPVMRRLHLPSGVEAVPLGRDVKINNQNAEIVSFVSNRAADELVNQQMAVWKASGMKVIGAATGRRGLAVAVDMSAGERWSFSAWSVPPELRAVLSGGRPVQGFMEVADMDVSGGGRERDGTVPGVPLMPGGKGGAVFSALDPGGRSYSGVYTNPGSLSDNVAFYRNELSGAGWTELNSEQSQPNGARFEVANVIFTRDSEQIVLLFSPSVGAADASDGDSGEKTVVSVTRGSLNIERWRALR
jgi:hypothetical protein